MSTVAVQRGLKSIEDILTEKGYNVVNMEEAEEPVDAIVFTGVNPDITGFQPLESYGGTYMGIGDTPDVVFVNAQGLSPEQVLAALEHRLGWED